MKFQSNWVPQIWFTFSFTYTSLYRLENPSIKSIIQQIQLSCYKKCFDKFYFHHFSKYVTVISVYLTQGKVFSVFWLLILILNLKEIFQKVIITVDLFSISDLLRRNSANNCLKDFLLAHVSFSNTRTNVSTYLKGKK